MQRRRLDRLDERRRDRLAVAVVRPERRQDDDRGRCPGVGRPERRGERDAVQLRHVHVEDGEVERLSGGHPGERLARRAGRGRAHPPALEQRQDDPPVGRVVVDDEDALAREIDQLDGLGRGEVRRDVRPRSSAGTCCPRRRRRRSRRPASRPSSSASRRLMASPRPVPPYRREIDASAWLNDWKSRSIRSAGMPMPVSRTSIASAQRSGPDPFVSGRPETLSSTSPLLGELDRVRQQVEHDLPEAAQVADDRPAAARSRSRRRARGPSRPPTARGRRAAPSMQARRRERLGDRGRPCRPRSSRSRGCR